MNLIIKASNWHMWISKILLIDILSVACAMSFQKNVKMAFNNGAFLKMNQIFSVYIWSYFISKH